MLMHSCWSIVFNMLSGIDLNSKGSKKLLFENGIGKFIWKKRKFISLSPPFLAFGLLARFLPRRPAGHYLCASPASRGPATAASPAQ